jgi:hypothetical protein
LPAKKFENAKWQNIKRFQCGIESGNCYLNKDMTAMNACSTGATKALAVKTGIRNSPK